MMRKILCVLLILVLCFQFTNATLEGILPSLSELDGTPMPSLGDVLHRYPFSEKKNDKDETCQEWLQVTEADYEAFSIYLTEVGAVLQDYSIENREITSTIAVNGKTFIFQYKPESQTAIVKYSAGTYDSRSYEANKHYEKAIELMEADKYAETYDELNLIDDVDQYPPASQLATIINMKTPDNGGYVEVPASLDESQPIELTFWAAYDTNRTQTAIFSKAADDFSKLYPNIKVNIIFYASYNRIYDDIVAHLSTNSTPDICITKPDYIATFMSKKNAILQMDNWMEDSRYGLGGSELRFDAPMESEIVTAFLDECKLKNHYYALPYMRATDVLYINQDLVEKMGYEIPEVLTWDFVWEVSEKAMEKNDDGTFKINGQEKMIPFIYKNTDNMMITMLRQLKVPYYSENGETQLFGEKTKAILKEIYEHTKTRAFSTFAISSYPTNFLNAGQCIFAADSTASSTWMGSEAPLQDIHPEQIIPFRIIVRPIPQYNPEYLQMPSQGPCICIFNKQNPQKMLASWLFAQYLLSNDIQVAYAKTEGYIPVTTKAQQSKEYQDYLTRQGEDNNEYYAVKIEASKLLLNHTADTFISPAFEGSSSLRSAAGQLIESICKSARRKKDMSDELLNEIFRETASLYMTTREPETEYVITDISWTRTIGIEEKKLCNKSGWELPEGAEQTGTKQEIHHYDSVLDHYEKKEKEQSKQIIDHYETYYTYTDNGDGTFKEEAHERPVYTTETYIAEVDEPVYTEVPRYATKYYYNIWKWESAREATASGTNQDAYWPEINLKPDEREGQRTEKYFVTLEKNGKSCTFSLKEEDWQQIKLFSKAKVEYKEDIQKYQIIIGKEKTITGELIE